MIAKELRALAPAWAAFAAAMLACGLVRMLYFFGIPAYFIGAAALGAMAFGHEYGYRTVPLMLTLPVSRNRILLTKLVVLAASLLLLAIAASIVLPMTREAAAFRGTVVWLPFVTALLITPYLTILTRSPLGGAVFTLGLSGMLMVAGEWIGVRKYGYTSDVDSFRVSFVWYAVLVLAAASTAALWRTFGRLQSLDGVDDVVDLAPGGATTARTLTRQNPTWLLIKKELRLQQLAFAVAALFVVLFTMLALRQDAPVPSSIGPILHAGVLSLLIGATASAEERHLRTLDAQLLLPMPAWRQWLIKIGVVFVLAIVLAILVPAALTAALTPSHITWSILKTLFFPKIVVGLLAICVVSLYVSTLCSSGIWALMLSVPSTFLATVFVATVGGQLQRYVHSLPAGPSRRELEGMVMIVSVVVLAVVLRLAFANHHSADRSAARATGQVAIAAASVILVAVVVGVAATLMQ